ncbi:uncharacterized protein B0I36DRAFT_128485 [Microdochium trichocladiopsis]|uniref:Uncharacterized protein n=1 Tax=Microdochium trichocladiopsis TaxID=1682393 RepID=A0A9P8Y3M4_9PEZI|nr:uncharacterized protein B0I36DRAFT_128485 [Microdochium trichocladiopsis]KAH7029118.1 hypothetical protein B0I36DRAFT_128485 [Microdochium trichocladiopsis]
MWGQSKAGRWTETSGFGTEKRREREAIGRVGVVWEATKQRDSALALGLGHDLHTETCARVSWHTGMSYTAMQEIHNSRASNQTLSVSVRLSLPLSLHKSIRDIFPVAFPLD